MTDEARGVFGLCTVLVLLQFPALAAEEVWRYVDARGTTHYTDSLVTVPPEYLHRAKEVSDLLEQDQRLSIAPEAGGLKRPKPDPEEWSFSALKKTPGVGSLAKLGSGMLLGLLLGAGFFLLLSSLLLKLACKLAAPVTPSVSGACGVILTQLLVMLGAGIIVALGAFALGVAPSNVALYSRWTQLAELSVTLILCSAVLGRMLAFPFAWALLVTLLE